MSVFVSIVAIGATLLALYAVDLWLGRVLTQALFSLVDRLPPYRPGGRYRSRSEPKRYASARKRRDVG
jgi:hypothetical protein